MEACWAHNPEVRGSKPRSAMMIFFLKVFLSMKESKDLSKDLSKCFVYAHSISSTFLRNEQNCQILNSRIKSRTRPTRIEHQLSCQSLAQRLTSRGGKPDPENSGELRGRIQTDNFSQVNPASKRLETSNWAEVKACMVACTSAYVTKCCKKYLSCVSS